MPTPDNKREEMMKDVGQKRDQAPFKDANTPDNKREKCCKKCFIPKGENCWDARCSCVCHSPDPFLAKTLAEFEENIPQIVGEDKLFGYKKVIEQDGIREIVTITDWENIIKFLRSALNTQRGEIREEVEKMKPERADWGRETSYEMEHANGYKKALNDVLALLSLNNKENE